MTNEGDAPALLVVAIDFPLKRGLVVRAPERDFRPR